MTRFRKYMFALLISSLILGGCSGIQVRDNSNPDDCAAKFIKHLKDHDARSSYDMFTFFLSESLPLEQLNELYNALSAQWGNLESYEEQTYIFHQRLGEKKFVQMFDAQKQLKRYTFECVFSKAKVNLDISLAKENDQYYVAWFSFWGDNAVLNDDLQRQMQDIFVGSAQD